ncbi:MAG: SLBB domain-containing protein [Bdellovibrionota bacterium]
MLSIKRILTFTVAAIFLQTQTALAQTSFFEVKEPPRAAEYIYRSSQKETLISVQLLGAVEKPGIYYIPAQTDLLKLVSLAGGTRDADLTEVLVRKTDPSQKGVYELDLNKLMKSTSEVKPFKLAQDDFVYIPKKQPWISSDIAQSVTIISLITSIILTSVLIEKNSD